MLQGGYGYIPNVDDLSTVLPHLEFSRGLSINGPAGEIFGRCQTAAFLKAENVQLPEGIYWFSSLDSPLIIQIHESDIQRFGAVSASQNELEMDLDHPLNSAAGWAEHYWMLAEQISPPLFPIDAAVQHAVNGTDMIIRDRDFVAGGWQYKVLMQGKITQLLESSITPIQDLGDPAAWLAGVVSSADEFGATLTRAKLEGRFANTIYSFRATRTIFRAYQFKPILKLLQTGKSRILIADEVGLGKTIEAGLVWTELEARKEADRVFVVCPASLVSKWKREMEERFGFELREFDKTARNEFVEKHEKDRLPNRFAYIASIEQLRIWDGLKLLMDHPVGIDFLVMDEAHSMRNMTTKNYATGALMAQLSTAAVFLTATPINLKQQDVLSLTGLLAPEDELDQETAAAQLEPNRYLNQISSILGRPNPVMGDLRDLQEQVKETEFGLLTAERPEFIELESILSRDSLSPSEVIQARRLIADLNALATVITRTRKAEVDEEKTVREAQKVEITWTEEETEFYRNFLEWCKAKAKRQNSHLLFSMQMPLRLASASLAVTREFVLSGAKNATVIKDEDDADAPKSTSTYDDVSEDLIKAARALPEGVDSKFDNLRRILNELHSTNRRAILFTFSKPTLSYLARRLGSEFRVAVLNGDVPHQKRNEIMAQFRAGGYDFVFANRVASEGLDFEFCSAVINYDLPWNPMEVEQRIGRIDRIGQPEKKILIVNFINEETVDERIMIRLLERIKIFEETIGELEPIIHSHMKEIWKQLDFDLDLEQIEKKTRQVELAIEEQKTLLNDVSDSASALFVSNDVDIDGLEDELLKSGRYVGQQELANLVRDWSVTDGGNCEIGDDYLVIRGTSQMADRVAELSNTGLRTRGETERLAAELRQEIPIQLGLNQEISRTIGGTLLNANHPLVMAAVTVPGHRQARFAQIIASSNETQLAAGNYAVIIAVAKNASNGGDEIWGEAVDLENLRSTPEAFNRVLSALASGSLSDGHISFDSEQAKRGVQRMMTRINEKHAHEQARRSDEVELFRRSRELALKNQYEKKMKSIEQRITKLEEKGVDYSIIRMFEGQRRMTEKTHSMHLSNLDHKVDPEIEIEYLAVCILGVQDGEHGTH